MRSGHVSTGRRLGSVEELARWWNAATQEARFALYEKSIKGDQDAPPLQALRIAIYLAEVEAGEVSEG